MYLIPFNEPEVTRTLTRAHKWVLKAYRKGLSGGSHWRHTDGAELFTLTGAAALGVCAIVAAAGIHMMSALTSVASPLHTAEAQPNYKWGHSTALAHEEELCVFRRRGNAGPLYLDCSPSYDKGRAPGGKLISARLPATATASTSAATIPNVLSISSAVASNPYWGNPGEIVPQKDPAVRVGWLNVDLPERAPKNLRLIKAEAQLDVEQAAAATNSKGSARASSGSGKGRCKARSYWNGKECRRRRTSLNK